MHHERLDGSGYPLRLKGEDIPVMVRIISAADAFCALTEDRAFRSALIDIEALDILSHHDRGKYDERILKVLADIYNC